MPPHTQHHRFSITSSFGNVADLAERVGDICARHPAGGEDLGDSLRLCVAEALNNIVEHAYDGADDAPIHASLRLCHDRCEVELIDEGRAMPGGLVPDGVLAFDPDSLAELPEGGFGWMLIRSQIDDIDYGRRGGCNVLRLTRRLGG